MTDARIVLISDTWPTLVYVSRALERGTGFSVTAFRAPEQFEGAELGDQRVAVAVIDMNALGHDPFGSLERLLGAGRLEGVPFILLHGEGVEEEVRDLAMRSPRIVGSLKHPCAATGIAEIIVSRCGGVPQPEGEVFEDF
jgi:hypothetical protein